MARVERALPLRGCVPRRGADLADRAQGDDLRDDRSGDRGADDVAAGGHRRHAQLGLPVLLAARLGARARGAARRRSTRTRRSPSATSCCASAPATRPTIQIMYGIGGERRLTEFELPELPGYEGSQAGPRRQRGVRAVPARRLRRGGRGHVRRRRAARQHRCAAVAALARRRRARRDRSGASPTTGSGRRAGPRRHYTYSKVMAWVVFDRAVRIAERYELDAPIDRWKADPRRDPPARSASEGYDARAQHLHPVLRLEGARRQRPQHSAGRLPARRPTSASPGRSTRSARELGRDGFVSRYSTAETDDGLAGDEGQFLACSFWLVSALALNGRLEEARTLFERLLGLTNDLGLLAEEYDVGRRRQVGNFPQAFSHLTLITRGARHLRRAEAQGAVSCGRERDGATARSGERAAGDACWRRRCSCSSSTRR